MGFYGNITNTARTQFQFDRVFANRHEMELKMPTDGIYAGRFVLIEYDNNATKENFPTFFIDLKTAVNGCFYGYTNSDKSEASRICYTEDISQIGPGYPLNATKGDIFFDDKMGFFYSVVDGKEFVDNDGVKKYALFEKIASETDSAYILNFNIDKAKYNSSRGYDSTVWQKVYANNQEKYVMVAELNTVVPTFDITVDAPTLAPINPHFDVSSTDVYYKLHMQPHWGFRVAEAKNENESDEKVVWIKQQYNQANDEMLDYYWDTDKKSWSLVDKDGKNQVKDLNGAIYYNKAGFDPTIETKSEKQDKIAVSPTGQSGQEYNSHDVSNSKKPAKDIQELEIILPSLGNAVADMWNIVYGPGDVYNDNRRNTDIQWDSLDGIRFATTQTGYQYNTNNIETLAGCINSVHDLMGMIVDEQPVNILEAEDNRIYWDEQKEIFSRKKKRYNYQEIPYEAYYYEEIQNVNEENYLPYTYYLSAGVSDEFIADDSGVYNENAKYYGRKIATNYLKTPQMCDYEPDKYYYLNGKHYSLETGTTFANDKKYFIISMEGMQGYNFKEVYQKNKYYYAQGGNYYLEKAETPAHDKYYIPTITKIEEKPFEKDIYYYQEGEKFYPYKEEFNPNIQYYSVSENNEIANTYIFTPISLFNPSEKEYYQKQGDDYVLTQIARDGQYYELTFYADKVYNKNELYEPNKYYYLKNDDFLFGIDNTYVSNETTYYALNPIPCVFYETNKYYIQSNGNYILASGFIDGVDYYTLGEDRYIKEDLKHSYATGSLWNNQIELVPYTVTLATREVDYIFEELKGFAKNYNTIHGLILRLSYLLEDGDKNTRDTSTVQGALNYLNDIFAKFDALKPKTLLSVGVNGRIYPATWTTEQEGKENNWISFGLDEVDHKITIQHTHPGTENNTTDIGKSSDQLSTFGRTFEIPEIKYDNMGHISSVKTHQVKMPIGSLNADFARSDSNVIVEFTMNNESGAITQSNVPISSLKLTGLTEVANGIIKNTQTISEAFSSIDTKIISEKSDRDVAINTLTDRIAAEENRLTNLIGGDLQPAFDTLQEMSIWLNNNDDELRQELVQADNALSSRITAIENIVKPESEEGSLVEQLQGLVQTDNDLNSRITTIENIVKPEDEENNLVKQLQDFAQTDNNLSSRITIIENIVKPEDEEKGLVKQLQDFVQVDNDLSSRITTIENIIKPEGEESNLIEQLLQRVNELEAIVNTLVNKDTSTIE